MPLVLDVTILILHKQDSADDNGGKLLKYPLLSAVIFAWDNLGWLLGDTLSQQ